MKLSFSFMPYALLSFIQIMYFTMYGISLSSSIEFRYLTSTSTAYAQLMGMNSRKEVRKPTISYLDG